MDTDTSNEPTPNVNRFANLYSLFQFAVSMNLKFPKIRLAFQNDTIVVKLAGSRSKYEGQLMVTNDAGFGAPTNKYFGRIDTNGAIYAGRDLTPAVEGLLEEFATNPVEVAQRYGKLTGNCMFCGKSLDDPTSVAVGYGPVCASKWNLPHSAAKQSRKSAATPRPDREAAITKALARNAQSLTPSQAAANRIIMSGAVVFNPADAIAIEKTL